MKLIYPYGDQRLLINQSNHIYGTSYLFDFVFISELNPLPLLLLLLYTHRRSRGKNDNGKTLLKQSKLTCVLDFHGRESKKRGFFFFFQGGA